MPEPAVAEPPVQTPATPATPSPTPTPATPAVETPPADLRKKIKSGDFWKNLGVPDEPAKPAAAKVEPAAPATPAQAKPAETPPATPTPAPAKKVAAKKPAEFDRSTITAIATESATAAAKAVLGTRPETPAAAQPAKQEITIESLQSAVETLPEELQAEPDVILEMQRLWPEKYAKLPSQMLELGPKLQQYKRQWEKENPDKDFDINDESHDAFWEDNVPKLSKSETRKAERSILKREAKSEFEQEFRPQLAEIEMHRKAQEVAPDVLNASTSVLSSILEGINPEYAKMSAKPEELAKLSAQDPEAGEAAAVVFDVYKPLIDESIKLFSGASKFSEKNPAHVAVWTMASRLESNIAALPVEDRMENGKLFATRADYFAMTPEEQKGRWIIGQEHMVYVIAGKAQTDAQNFYKKERDKFEKSAKARGLKIEPVTPAQPEPPAKNGELEKPAVTETPSPSVTGKTTIRHDTPPGAGNSPKWLDSFGFGAKGG